MYTDAEIEKFIQAGKLTAQIREYGAELIHVGAPLKDVADKIEQKIIALGGKPAFPAQISLNDIAAHYCPIHNDDSVFKQGDLAKLDVGVHVDGFIGDTAITVDLGNHHELVQASKEALQAALDIVKPGITTSEIGQAIHHAIQARGFAPVRNLSGHGLGQWVIHGAPSIPNYNNGSKEVLQRGDVIAIEPFASSGAGFVKEDKQCDIFQLIGKRPIRSQITRKVLSAIEQYHGLPFTTRWLTQKFPLFEVSLALREMNQLGMLHGYAPLRDEAKGMVSQAEHTIIVDDPIVVLTR